MGEPALGVKPVTPETWRDMVRLFEGKGCPHYCWCTPYRHPRSHDREKSEKKATMESLVADGTPVGMLASRRLGQRRPARDVPEARALPGDAGRRRRGRLDYPVPVRSARLA